MYRLHTQFLSILGIILLTSISSAYGFQINLAANSNRTANEMNAYLISSEYESLLEYRIDQRLEQYFPTSRFITNVEVTFLQNIEAIGQNPQAIDEENDNSKLYTAVPNFLLNNLDEDVRTRGDKIAQELGLYLNNILVRINLDESYNFSNDEVDFIRFAIESIIKYDVERGDQISIEYRIFPDPLNAGNNVDINENFQILTDSLARISGGNNASTSELLAASAGLQNSLNLLFLVLLLISGVILFFFVSNRNNKRGGSEQISPQSVVVQSNSLGSLRDDITVSTDMVRNLSHTIKNEGVIEYSINNEGSKEDREIESLQFLMKLTSDRPTDMARILEYWFGYDMHKTIQVILSVDIKIMIMLKPYISKSVYQKLVSTMNEFFEIDMYENRYTLEELAKEIKGFEQSRSFIFKYQPVKDYNFIQLMKTDELKNLVENLSLEDTALVIGHCSKDIVRKLGDMIDTEYLNEVIKTTWEVQKMPLLEYRNRSNAIFKEVHLNHHTDHIPNAIISDVVEIIEGLEIEKQQDVIRLMKKKGDTHSYAIAENIVTLDTLVSLEHDVLSNVIGLVKSETLALAIRGFGSDIQERIISLRPDRERMYIEKIMHSEEYNARDIKIAQNKLLDQLRNVISKTKKVNVQI